MGTTASPHPMIRLEPRVSPDVIRRLYLAEARGLADAALIDEVGYALLVRCETIRRVTERRCPACGQTLLGVEGRDRQRIIRCPDCAWQATWARYHASYKRDRVHGGRAYPAFLAYLAEFPRCASPQARMLCIDRLIHAVHVSLDRIWTRPAAENLIRGTMGEIEALLDGLAGNPQAGLERQQVREQYRQQMALSRLPTERKREEIRRRHLARGLDFKATDDAGNNAGDPTSQEGRT